LPCDPVLWDHSRVISALERLTGLLGGPVPAAVAALPDEDLERLADQITTARRRQSDRLDASARKAVSGVPLPVRGIVRRALLG
jgi:hypothetical protein